MKTLNRLFFFLFVSLLMLSCCSFAYSDSIITSDIPKSTLIFSDIPEYFGEDYAILNNDIPEFDNTQLTEECFVFFSSFDSLGRTSTGFACLGPETLPFEPRGTIGDIRPSGWHTVRYDDLIEDRYLYNRSHVIGYLLCSDNATPENLFTGTRYLNAGSMLKFEVTIAQYIRASGNHVLYRVSPMYEGDNLVAYGVHLEALSIEDEGHGICINVFLYNIQPGILIDYATGESWRDAEYVSDNSQLFELIPIEEDKREIETRNPFSEIDDIPKLDKSYVTYVLNTNTMKFHYSDCSSVDEIKPKNMQDFDGTREQAIAEGYSPCGKCKP